MVSKALADPDGEYADYFYFRKGKTVTRQATIVLTSAAAAGNRFGNRQILFHMFAKEQPDLNWENPKLRQELYNMINWWLEKGLAGFRIDAIINIKKDLAFPDYERTDRMAWPPAGKWSKTLTV